MPLHVSATLLRLPAPLLTFADSSPAALPSAPLTVTMEAKERGISADMLMADLKEAHDKDIVLDQLYTGA